MSSSINEYDSIDRLIFEEGLRIQAIDVHKDLDLMLVILNTKAILRQKLSAYPELKTADEEIILEYQLISDGIGIQWPQIDEDLSLKGFLQDELRAIVTKNFLAA